MSQVLQHSSTAGTENKSLLKLVHIPFSPQKENRKKGISIKRRNIDDFSMYDLLLTNS